MAKKLTKNKRSNSYDPALREIIAWRIGEGRRKIFAGRGGQTRCAAEYGISPQQWSQYESGHRSPEDKKLEEIAKHLKTTVQKLMTPPENWTVIRDEWVAARSGEKRKANKPGRPKTAVEKARDSLGMTAEPVSPTAELPHANPTPDAGRRESHRSIIMESIQKLINADRLHAEGKISTENLASTLKSVDVLIESLHRDVTR